MAVPKTSFVASIALLIVLSACEQADPTPQASAATPALEQALANIEFSREPGHPMDVLQDRVDVAVDAMYRVAAAETWEEANAVALREIEAAEPGVIRQTVEQAVSKVLVVGYLVPNQADARTSELALAYTHRLVDRRSPEAEAVLAAVDAFGPAWGPEETRRIALDAADVVEAHVRDGSACRDCDLPADLRRALTERGLTTDVVNLRRLDTARQLRALAG